MIPFPSVKLTVNFIKEGKQVVAYSPALDISTVGDSEEHAKTRFVEMVGIFLKDISDRKVVDDVLSELGWTKAQPNAPWVPPAVHSVDLQVPMMA
jgi:hypothetical protein